MAGLLRISEAYVLAFHAMAYLVNSSSDRPVSAADLAATFHVSEAHLAKVLQRLARLGLLASRRGPKGGFVLSCDPAQVTLLDIHTAVDGPLDENTCLLGEHMCEPGTCVMESLLRDVHHMVREQLAKTRLADLAPLVKRRGEGEPVGADRARA
jgi:Rrf2 family protein